MVAWQVARLLTKTMARLCGSAAKKSTSKLSKARLARVSSKPAWDPVC